MTISYDEMKQAIGLNWYLTDPHLQRLMDRFIDAPDRSWVEGKLRAMGELIGGPVAANAEVTDKNPPRLVNWNRDGDEVGEVVLHESALETKRLLWKNDFLHLRWSDEVKERGRPVPAPLYFAYQYLLSQAETGMLCSVGMTTGVLRLIERYGDDATKAMFVPKLKTNDFDAGWDGSMYLTEKAGGSDLGTTETVARKDGDSWRLTGFKWFCSNVDGDAIVTLARPEGSPEGIKGLGLFAVPRKLPDGSLNGVHTRRIKDKLGTRAVPTGEIDLVDAKAFLLAGGGEATDGRGINRMMEFVNESRMGVATMGAGIMRRVALEAIIRAHQRVAFGRRLVDHGMVRETLVDLIVESEAAATMLMQAASRIPTDGGAIGDGDPLARILVPLTKLRCTRGGIESASAALEVFGGNGYIEDWPMARQLRDAQCHTIWEGTENILSLDMLRTMAKHASHEPLLAMIGEARAAAAGHELLAAVSESVGRATAQMTERLGQLAAAEREVAKLRSRRVANELATVSQGALLLSEAARQLEGGDARAAVVAAWFARKHLEPGGSWHPGNEGIVMRLFDAVIGYDRIAPEEARSVARL